MGDIQNVLKELRLQNKYTQGYIANYLCITQQAYANYENGKRLPDIEKLIMLADLYNISLDILTGRYKKSRSE